VIDSWRTSGLTVAAFAREAGLKASRVYGWREQIGAAPAKAGSREAPVLLPVVLRGGPTAPPPGARAPITVCARDGLRVEVAALDAASAAWVATLMRSLGEGVAS